MQKDNNKLVGENQNLGVNCRFANGLMFSAWATVSVVFMSPLSGSIYFTATFSQWWLPIHSDKSSPQIPVINGTLVHHTNVGTCSNCPVGTPPNNYTQILDGFWTWTCSLIWYGTFYILHMMLHASCICQLPYWNILKSYAAWVHPFESVWSMHTCSRRWWKSLNINVFCFFHRHPKGAA